jgi:serpin B
MMRLTDYFPYYQGKDFQAVTLPYGLSQRFGMVVVLPRRGMSLAQFAPRLSRTNWGYWVKQMRNTQYGELAMPRVDAQYSKDLVGPLKVLGMRNVFTNAADFSGVCPISCKISKVVHKTILHIDEKGTTAAPVTSIALITGGGAPPPPPFHMVIDHPFFLGIRDGRTGAILFLGAINHP